MRITVGICTWNRCDLLAVVLEHLTKLSIPTGLEWELLVVNNNSTDRTDEVIESFRHRLPLRRLFEAKPGKSNALNKGAEEAKGDYIVWADNDVLVDEQWLAGYCQAFQRFPNSVVFGGAIEPWLDGMAPSWVQKVIQQFPTVYGIRDFGPQPVPLSEQVLPYGANMAVRTAEQRRFLYDAALGPNAGNAVRGEETAMVRKMLADGLEGWWIPDARVRHYIPREHQTVDYLRKYFMGQGEVQGRELRSARTIFGKPRHLWRSGLEAEVRYRFYHLLGKENEWLENLRVASESWGQIRGYKSTPT